MGKKRKKTIERQQERGKAELLQKIKSLNQKPKQLVVGCNAVLRSLEKNELDLVAISREINFLVFQPINMLCTHHGVQLLHLDSQELSGLNFKISKVTAFGTKKIVADEVENLKKLIQDAGMRKTNTRLEDKEKI